MRVRATRPFSAYRPENCTVITADAGQEFTADTARYLLDTHAPVEVVEDPADAESTDDPAPASDPVGEAPVGEAPVGEAPVGERVDDDSAPPPVFDPAAHTVDDVLDYVNEHPDQRDAVRVLEAAGKQRTTILRALD